MDQAQCHRLVLFARDGVFDTRFQHLTAIDNRSDLGNRPEGCILF